MPTATTSKFLAQTLKSAFHKKAIDSIRPRYSNSHVVLEELKFVCHEIENERIPKWHIFYLIEEAKKIISNDYLLNKKYPKKVKLIERQLGTFMSNNDITYLKNFLDLELVYFSKKYLDDLCNEVTSICDNRKRAEMTYESLSNYRTVIYSLISELLFRGISFAHLRHISQNLELKGKSDVRNLLKKLLKPKKYRTIIVLLNLNKNVRNLFRKNLKVPPLTVLSSIPQTKNKNDKYTKIRNAAKNPSSIIFSAEGHAYDGFGALLNSQYSIEPLANFIHLNYSDRNIDFFEYGMVLETKQKSWQTFKYESLVKFEYINRFLRFKKNITPFHKLLQNSAQQGITEKVASCLSHLSYSRNQDNVLNAYLNAWIALEVLFSCIKKIDEKTKSQMRTFELIKELVPKISAINYLDRLVNNLGRDLLNMNHGGQISRAFYDNFTDGTEKNFNAIKLTNWLRDKDKSATLLKELEHYPYQAHKTEYIIRNIKDGKTIQDLLRRHTKNIESHLCRLYRIRNDLVHNAATINKSDLYNLSSISLLCFNVQEYTADTLEKIFVYTEKGKPQNLTDVAMGLISIYDKLLINLEEPNFSSEEIINPFIG